MLSRISGGHEALRSLDAEVFSPACRVDLGCFDQARMHTTEFSKATFILGPDK